MSPRRERARRFTGAFWTGGDNRCSNHLKRREPQRQNGDAMSRPACAPFLGRLHWKTLSAARTLAVAALSRHCLPLNSDVAGPFRARQREQGVDRGVILVAAARERMRAGRVETALADVGLVDMECDDLADREDAAAP